MSHRQHNAYLLSALITPYLPEDGAYAPSFLHPSTFLICPNCANVRTLPTVTEKADHRGVLRHSAHYAVCPQAWSERPQNSLCLILHRGLACVCCLDKGNERSSYEIRRRLCQAGLLEERRVGFPVRSRKETQPGVALEQPVFASHGRIDPSEIPDVYE